MTPEERDELATKLKAAGCDWLADLTRTIGDDRIAGYQLQELRSLLRREVWVATHLHKYGGDGDEYMQSLAFSSMQQMCRWAESSGLKDDEWDHEVYTIDAEVPDGSN